VSPCNPRCREAGWFQLNLNAKQALRTLRQESPLCDGEGTQFGFGVLRVFIVGGDSPKSVAINVRA
jgi:hypothetical protein